MRKGITIIEIVILVILLIGISLFIVPRILRGRANASSSAKRTELSRIMSEVETYRTKTGNLPAKVSDLSGNLNPALLNGMYDQNPNDALISTDGRGAVKDVEAFEFNKFIFLVKTINAPNGTVDPLVRAVMRLPSRFDKRGENGYYRTNESPTTYLWPEAWELATNSPVSYADASGQPMYFKPAGPKSLHTSLVYEVNLSSTYFKSGN